MPWAASDHQHADGRSRCGRSRRRRAGSPALCGARQLGLDRFFPRDGAAISSSKSSSKGISELYVSVLGRDDQLAEIDERLAQLNLRNPEEVDDLAAALFGSKDAAARNWHDHYRTWRKRRLAEMARSYGDQLDEVAAFLATFANQVTQLGPKGYLQAMAHKQGEEVDDSLLQDDREG